MLAELEALKGVAGAAGATRAVMRAMPTPRATAVHEAGDFRAAGAAVTTATPAWLPGGDAAKPPRLALAEWLVSPDNPLTPRVTVNRAWQSFFGQGLVATADDFGCAGIGRRIRSCWTGWRAS
ncbi:MAG: DUF1553 domain-containing protein [Planctomycetaceae bacterium]